MLEDTTLKMSRTFLEKDIIRGAICCLIICKFNEMISIVRMSFHYLSRFMKFSES